MKPSCMSITRTAATTTQVVSTATVRSLTCCFKGDPFARVGAQPAGPETGRPPVCARRRTASFAPSTGFPVAALYGWRGGLLAHGGDPCLSAIREAAGIDAEQAVRVPGGRPDAVVAQELLVEHHLEPVADRGHAADREAGGRADLVGAGLAYLGAVEHLGDLVGVDPVLAGRHADDGLAVADEHDRLGDLTLCTADGAGGVPHGAGRILEPLDGYVEPQVPDPRDELVSHC